LFFDLNHLRKLRGILVHFTMTIGLLLFFVVHVLQVARSGWGNFRSMITGYVIERRPPSVAADATARKDWVTLQNQIELTRSDLTAQSREMQEAHSRLEEERRVMEGDRRFDLLSSSAINALGSILACLVPLLLVGWLLRRQDQNEEPTLLPELYCEQPTETPSNPRSLYLNDQLTHSDNNDFYHEENS
jgi:hypothetical protein